VRTYVEADIGVRRLTSGSSTNAQDAAARRGDGSRRPGPAAARRSPSHGQTGHGEQTHSQLRGHHIEVDHTIGGNPSVTALSYQKRSFSKTFKPGEIHADPTVLGSLVSVALVKTIDTGGELFRVPFAADRRSARSNRSFHHGRHLRALQRAELDPASPDDVGDFRA
jgi:hypothetical protein